MLKNEIIQQVMAFSAKLTRPSPPGCCFSVSYEFSEVLYHNGHNMLSIQFGWLDGKDHCWIEVWADDMLLTLIDFTADQFGDHYPPLIMGPVEDMFKLYKYTYDTGETEDVTIWKLNKR